jgi:CRP/FNR family transcriptional regulator, dissimilatory nitrate respiration regulator
LILTQEKYFDLISKTILFEGLPDDYIHQLLGLAREREFPRNEIIFSEGDPANGFYVNADGLVKIYKLSSEGKEQILHIFGPGEPFGEVPVFSGQTFPAYAEALTSIRALFFPRQAFVKLVSDNPSLALNLLAVLSMRLRRFTVQIENLSLKEVPGRLAAYFLMLSVEQNTPKSVILNITKSHLASFLGTIPETLSRMLNRMAAMELIRVEGRRISLMDIDGLKLLAETGKFPGAEE